MRRYSERVEYDPSFFRKSPHFWPLARAAARLERCPAWPTPEDLSSLFEGEAPVRFERPEPKPRREKLPAEERYDAKIALERVVPTRPGSWHDLFNALVWATFPRAKLTLHTRQHRIISSRLGEDLRLPGARTREQDAIAMFDEGGVVLLGSARAVFGHAIYESLTTRVNPSPLDSVRAAGFRVPTNPNPPDTDASLRAADEVLSALFSRVQPITRDDFETLVVETVAR
jgi:hypothetical protein